MTPNPPEFWLRGPIHGMPPLLTFVAAMNTAAEHEPDRDAPSAPEAP